MMAGFYYIMLLFAGLIVFQIPRIDIEPIVGLMGQPAVNAWCYITGKQPYDLKQQKQQLEDASASAANLSKSPVVTTITVPAAATSTTAVATVPATGQKSSAATVAAASAKA